VLHLTAAVSSCSLNSFSALG